MGKLEKISKFSASVAGVSSFAAAATTFPEAVAPVVLTGAGIAGGIGVAEVGRRYVRAVSKDHDDLLKRMKDNHWVQKYVGDDKILNQIMSASSWLGGSVTPILRLGTEVAYWTAEKPGHYLAQKGRMGIVGLDQSLINNQFGRTRRFFGLYSDVRLRSLFTMKNFANRANPQLILELPFSQYRKDAYGVPQTPEGAARYAEFQALTNEADRENWLNTEANMFLQNAIREGIGDDEVYKDFQKSLSSDSNESIRYRMILRSIIDRFAEIFNYEPGSDYVYVSQVYNSAQRKEAKQFRSALDKEYQDWKSHGYQHRQINIPGFNPISTDITTLNDTTGTPLFDIRDLRTKFDINPDTLRYEKNRGLSPLKVYEDEVWPEIFNEYIVTDPGYAALTPNQQYIREEELRELFYKLVLRDVDPDGVLEMNYLAGGKAVTKEDRDKATQRAASLGKKGVLREIAAYDKDVIATNFPGTASLPAGLRKFAGKLADAVATPEVKAAIEEGSVTDDSIIKLFELSSDSLRNPVELTKAFASMTTDLEKLRGAVNTTLEDKEKDKAEEIMDGVGQLLGKISAYIANGIANNYESGRRRGRAGTLDLNAFKGDTGLLYQLTKWRRSAEAQFVPEWYRAPLYVGDPAAQAEVIGWLKEHVASLTSYESGLRDLIYTLFNIKQDDVDAGVKLRAEQEVADTLTNLRLEVTNRHNDYLLNRRPQFNAQINQLNIDVADYEAAPNPAGLGVVDNGINTLRGIDFAALIAAANNDIENRIHELEQAEDTQGLFAAGGALNPVAAAMRAQLRAYTNLLTAEQTRRDNAIAAAEAAKTRVDSVVNARNELNGIRGNLRNSLNAFTAAQRKLDGSGLLVQLSDQLNLYKLGAANQYQVENNIRTLVSDINNTFNFDSEITSLQEQLTAVRQVRANINPPLPAGDPLLVDIDNLERDITNAIAGIDNYRNNRAPGSLRSLLEAARPFLKT